MIGSIDQEKKEKNIDACPDPFLSYSNSFYRNKSFSLTLFSRSLCLFFCYCTSHQFLVLPLMLFMLIKIFKGRENCVIETECVIDAVELYQILTGKGRENVGEKQPLTHLEE